MHVRVNVNISARPLAEPWVRDATQAKPTQKVVGICAACDVPQRSIAARHMRSGTSAARPSPAACRPWSARSCRWRGPKRSALIARRAVAVLSGHRRCGSRLSLWSSAARAAKPLP